MISRLSARNFRRHEDLELRFSPDDQIVLVAGGNGAGKSSIFEAVLFALYGESRQGRRGLDALCRRGAEYEGLEVTVEFDVADVAYRVTRRRDSSKATAVLYANDVALTDGTREVTAEVCRVLGMDSTGFRLATLAQQKELDALAALRPAARAEAVSRLLRLDALTAARADARTKKNDQQRLYDLLPSGHDAAELADLATAAAASAAATRAAADAARSHLDEIDASLAELAELAHAARAAAQHHAAQLERADALESAAAAATKSADEIVVPTAPDFDPADLITAEATEASLTERLARAAAAAQSAAQRASRLRELDELNARISELGSHVGTPLDVRDDEIARLDAAVTTNAQDLAAARAALEAARVAHAAAHSALSVATRDLDVLTALGGACDTCGQEISEEHRHRRTDALEAARARAHSDEEAAAEALRDARSSLAALEADASTAADHLADARRSRQRTAEVLDEISGLRRRADHATAIVERLAAEDAEDTEELRDALTAAREDISRLRADAAAATSAATAAAEAAATRAAAAAATERATEARAAAAAAELPEHLATALESHDELCALRADEAALAAALELEAGTAAATASLATERAEHAASQRDQRAKVALDVEVAGAAARLLTDATASLSAQVGPTLEGSISDMLDKLSEGRFDSARVGPDYDISVRDTDGEYYPLSEFSGGEIDLIALATRLALASLVADQSATHGPGFLILDECFGSQDPARRASILTSLRNLRSTYGQIFLISHVGGLADAADVVVELASSEDRSSTEVSLR